MSNPLILAIDKFFGDTSRSPEQTAAGLLDAISHAKTLLEALPETDEAFLEDEEAKQD